MWIKKLFVVRLECLIFEIKNIQNNCKFSLFSIRNEKGQVDFLSNKPRLHEILIKFIIKYTNGLKRFVA